MGAFVSRYKVLGHTDERLACRHGNDRQASFPLEYEGTGNDSPKAVRGEKHGLNRYRKPIQ